MDIDYNLFLQIIRQEYPNNTIDIEDGEGGGYVYDIEGIAVFSLWNHDRELIFGNLEVFSQGIGIGSKITELIVNFAREEECLGVRFFKVNPDSLKMFKKLYDNELQEDGEDMFLEL